MSRMQTSRAAILAFAITGLFPMPSLAAASDGDCEVDRPAARDDGGDATGNPLSGPTLSKRLATCGSVLDPPAVGDPDIVEPTPKTDDPINLRPQTRQGDRP